jgi:hypothetical protein
LIEETQYPSVRRVGRWIKRAVGHFQADGKRGSGDAGHIMGMQPPFRSDQTISTIKPTVPSGGCNHDQRIDCAIDQDIDRTPGLDVNQDRAIVVVSS